MDKNNNNIKICQSLSENLHHWFSHQMLQCVHSQPCTPETQRAFQLAGRMMVASQVQEASTATSLSAYGAIKFY